MKTLVSDPFVTTVILGTLWPLIQAALDRPWWTRGRRVALVVTAAVVLTVGTWALSAYPLQVELLAGQIGKFQSNRTRTARDALPLRRFPPRCLHLRLPALPGMPQRAHSGSDLRDEDRPETTGDDRANQLGFLHPSSSLS